MGVAWEEGIWGLEHWGLSGGLKSLGRGHLGFEALGAFGGLKCLGLSLKG